MIIIAPPFRLSSTNKKTIKRYSLLNFEEKTMQLEDGIDNS